MSLRAEVFQPLQSGTTISPEIRISFHVGDTDFPQTGDTVWIPLDEEGEPLLINRSFVLFREGDREFQDTVKGYSFNETTGAITFHPALHKEAGDVGEWILLETSRHTQVAVEELPLGNYLAINDAGDQLLISDTDYLLL